MNPTWAKFLAEILESGALTTEDPSEKRKLGLKTNPDGDVDVPGVDYNSFRYPVCPKCLHDPELAKDIRVDDDGAWAVGSNAGILKPAVIMFGESIPDSVKRAVEMAVDDASALLVLGSSLATYSAWRLVKRAKERGIPIAAVNMGGIRGEETFFRDITSTDGSEGVRCSLPLERVLPALVERMKGRDSIFTPAPWA
jgi:NAD-dependent SIR2 family protein deacetylase